MNKKTVLWVLLELVFLVVFNIVFFAWGGTDHPTSVWLSYVFIHLAYLMVVLTPFLVRRGSNEALFSATITTISAVYFFAAFVAGLIFIFIRSENIKPALIVQVILFGIYAIILLINLLSNEKTANSEKKREQEVAFIKEAASRAKLLVDKMGSKKANKQVEKVYDLLHSSPTKTVPAVADLEKEILDKVDELDTYVFAQDEANVIKKAEALLQLIEERNRLVKL